MDKKEFLKGWRTEKTLGKGSFGTVYEISRVNDDGTVEKSALKVVNIPKNEEELLEYQTMYTDAELPAFFEVQKNAVVKEFETMQMFSNDKHIVSYQEHNVSKKEDGQGWTAVARMELLTPLTAYLKTHALTERDVVNIGIDICCGLETLNAAGVVHRDIKYQNMFIDDDKNFKLGDFGTARSLDHTTMATKKGTIGFMAPEVYNNTPCNQTLDYYSVGMVLYWLLNERRIPFLPLPPAIPTPSQNEMAITRRMSGEQIPEPKFGSNRLKKVIAKAMEFDPAKRYKTATEMKFDLIEVLQKEYLETVVLNQSGVAPVVYPAATATETITETIAEPSIETVTESVFEKTVVPDITETITVFGNIEIKQEEKAETKQETKQEKEIDIEKTVSVFDSEKKVVKEEPKPKKKSKLGLLIGLAAVIATVVLGIVFFGGDKEITSNNLVYWGVDSSNVLRLSTAALTPSETAKASGSFYESEGMSAPRSEWKEVVAVEVKDLVSPVGKFSFEGLVKCKTMDISKLDTSRITDMERMFFQCSSISNLDLSGFNIKNVTTMKHMFFACNFNSLNLSRLNLSKVGNLYEMFGESDIKDIIVETKYIPKDSRYIDMLQRSRLTGSFLGLYEKVDGKEGNIYWGIDSNYVLTISSTKISGNKASKASGFFDERDYIFYAPKEWSNVKSVIVLDRIAPKGSFSFAGLTQCESIDLTNMDTSSITNMSSMFKKCEKLHSISGLDKFDTSSVTTMKSMFSECRIINEIDVSSFDTRNVTSMHDMFAYCNALKRIDVQNFETSNVTIMEGMFYECYELESFDVSRFDTSNVESMSAMFAYNHKVKRLDLSKWNTGRVNRMMSMFYECKTLTNLDLSNFDTSDVTNMSSMFFGCENLKQLDLSNFNTTNVLDMGYMFGLCENLTSLNLNSFDTSNVTSMYCMFAYDHNLANLVLGNNFKTGNVTDMYAMFFECQKLGSIDVSGFDTSNVTNMANMFYKCESVSKLDLSNFNTSNVLDMGYMFGLCENLASLNLNSFDTSNVTSMYCMFAYDHNLANLILGNSFKTGNVTDMYAMFFECQKLGSIDVSGFDTSNVTNMTNMFYKCESVSKLDLSNFNTSNVLGMSSMFALCRKLEHIDVSHFDTSKVTNMFDMFAYCNNLRELDLSQWNTSNVTDMQGMFYQCYELEKLDVTGFNTSKVDNMQNMFVQCKKLKYVDLSSFDMSNVKESSYMFLESGLTANSTGLRI